MKYENLIFSTSTILNWQKIIHEYDLYELIYDSWRYLVATERVYIHAYVIMPNHIHWIYQIRKETDNQVSIKHSLLSFTSKKILKTLGSDSRRFYVNKSNKRYQIWKSTRDFHIYYPNILRQKINYIHLNPVKVGLVTFDNDYSHSSAKYYQNPSGCPEFLSVI